MAVDPGQHDEYERRHQPISQELESVLLAHGVVTYSIYLDDATGDLFGYVEVEDEARWAAVAETEACRRWWRFMRDVMPSNPDDSPVSRDLREVFHLGRSNGGRRREPGPVAAETRSLGNDLET